MTEKLPPLSTKISIPSQSPPTANGPTSAAPKDVPQKVGTGEEEPYTIKCICNFPDDDGNTIYCDDCDTWQHIDCFYPDSREDALSDEFKHLCHQCNPRELDHQRAIERTRKLQRVLVEEQAHDKKAKRPAARSHKKKPKPTDLQLNGAHPGPDSSSTKHPSPVDHHPPAKKAKTSHRSSHSISSSQPPKKSPSHSHSKSQLNGQQPSPVTTPPDLPVDFELHNYSANFYSLHNEPDVQIVQSNSFASLAVSNKLSYWLHDRDSLENDTGQVYKDVFQVPVGDIEPKKRTLRVEQKTHSPTPDRQLRLQYLIATSAIEKDVPLMELNGQIGFQNDYCANLDNLWPELTSPLPFVFFHPMLPLYIDTRREGSEARYVRRSCKPNAVLDTYLSGGSEYHFWLVSDRHISAKEQITLPWDFRFPNKDKARLLYRLGLSDDEIAASGQPDMDDAEYQQISTWLHRLLSEYGGCACDLANNCAFARFHRHYLARTHSRTVTSKKKRKAKASNISPTSTGHATNSRAPSEGHPDDVMEHDRGSASSRSKPPSRERTPARQGSLDRPGILTEPTDRDKRKIAMAEDTFRRMEQQQQLLHKAKKKRVVSDGSSSSKARTGKSSANTTPNLANGVHYVDAGTSRSKSGSPASAMPPRARFPPFPAPTTDTMSRSSQPPTSVRGTYCDASVQTDPVEGEWFSPVVPSPKPRRRVISLSQRLLNNRHQHRLEEEQRRQTQLANAEAGGAMEIDSPTTEHSTLSSPIVVKDAGSTTATPPTPTPGDVTMTDAPSSSPTAPAPTQPSAKDTDSTTVRIKTPDLRVQLPPVPAFTSNASGGPLTSTTTPMSATGSMVQSPFSATSLTSPFSASVNANGVHPSPVKKKLSLSDYRKSRLDKAAGKPTTPLKPCAEDSKAAAGEAGADVTGDKGVPDGGVI